MEIVKFVEDCSREDLELLMKLVAKDSPHTQNTRKLPDSDRWADLFRTHFSSEECRELASSLEEVASELEDELEEEGDEDEE
jgi:hypothetical protein